MSKTKVFLVFFLKRGNLSADGCGGGLYSVEGVSFFGFWMDGWMEVGDKVSRDGGKSGL